MTHSVQHVGQEKRLQPGAAPALMRMGILMTITAGALRRGDHIAAGRVYVAVENVRAAAGRMVEVMVRGGGIARFHADEYVTIGGGAR